MLRRHPDPPAKIIASERGLDVAIRKHTYSIAWGDIRSIVAFKRDLLTVDLICLEVRWGEGHSVELDEEMDGWDDLRAALSAHLPDIRDGWWQRVMSPAFATNRTEVFTRRAV